MGFIENMGPMVFKRAILEYDTETAHGSLGAMTTVQTLTFTPKSRFNIILGIVFSIDTNPTSGTTHARVTINPTGDTSGVWTSPAIYNTGGWTTSTLRCNCGVPYLFQTKVAGGGVTGYPASGASDSQWCFLVGGTGYDVKIQMMNGNGGSYRNITVEVFYLESSEYAEDSVLTPT